MIDQRNENNQRDGVEVIDDIIGYTTQLHRRGLRRQITRHLIVGEEVNGCPEEDFAGG